MMRAKSGILSVLRLRRVRTCVIPRFKCVTIPNISHPQFRIMFKLRAITIFIFFSLRINGRKLILNSRSKGAASSKIAIELGIDQADSLLFVVFDNE